MLRLPTRRATSGQASKPPAGAIIFLTLALAVAPTLPTHAQDSVTATGVAANRVLNWSFETFEGVTPLQRVAQYWDAFVLSGNSVEFCQGTTAFAGINVERIDGNDSQIIKSDEPFDAGLYQIITGLQPNQWYSAIAYILTVFQTSAVENPSDFDGKMIKQIGVDPTGGRNPLSPEVIWSDPIDKNMDRNTWGHRMVFQAIGTSATFFIRVQALEGVSHEAYDNIAYIDGAQIRLAPVSQATVPETTAGGPFEVKWQAVVPNAFATEAVVISYDVQWRDGQGPWQPWFTESRQTAAVFDQVVPGHEYTFRVRAWARYQGTPAQGGFAEIFGPWAESAPVRLGRVIEATALDNRGYPVAGVPFELVGPSGPVASAKTDGAGHAYLAGQEGVPYRVVAKDTWFLAPPPVEGAVIGPGISPVVVTVRPPDDVVPDGSFETATVDQAPGGWSTSGPTARATGYKYHTGLQSVELSTDSLTTGVCIARSFTVQDAYLPVLSFWYNLQPGQGGMSTKVLRVQARDAAQMVLAEKALQSQTPTDWSHAYLLVTQDESPYTGEVTVEFCLRDPEGAPTTTTAVDIFIDDVSLGSASGGPVKSYLPVTCK
jgi:hypothetical protein